MNDNSQLHNYQLKKPKCSKCYEITAYMYLGSLCLKSRKEPSKFDARLIWAI